jgi:hypothetical protein
LDNRPFAADHGRHVSRRPIVPRTFLNLWMEAWP